VAADDERRLREHALLGAVRAGDEAAWRAWYDASFAALDAYVRWRCGGLRAEADEMVQDVWLTAVRRIGAFDPDRAPFAAWLRGIAAGLLRNRFRRRPPPPPRPAPPAPGADAEAERRDQAERVARALAALPEHYEEVLRAKYLDGRAVADIAAERGEAAKAVESRLTRARQAFREAYGDEP
jgi:RNA polymerase sigma-70 factor (ECF subfamily)